jgi:hypothetical protein
MSAVVVLSVVKRKKMAGHHEEREPAPRLMSSSDEAWTFLYREVVRPIVNESVTGDAQIATAIQCIGSPLAREYFAASFGHSLPLRVASALSDATNALRTGAETVMGSAAAKQAGFENTSMLTLADVMAHFRRGEDDKRALYLLRQTGAGRLPVSERPSADTLFVNSPVVERKGWKTLHAFFEMAIEPALSEQTLEKWTWADVAMVALVLSTSVHWEERLARIFSPDFLPSATLYPLLARFMLEATLENPTMQSALEEGHVAVELDPLLTLTCLRLLQSADAEISGAERRAELSIISMAQSIALDDEASDDDDDDIQNDDNEEQDVSPSSAARVVPGIRGAGRDGRGSRRQGSRTGGGRVVRYLTRQEVVGGGTGRGPPRIIRRHVYPQEPEKLIILH